MIKYTNDADSIVKIWHEAFGDTREDIELFINSVNDAKCLGYYDGEKLASMLYLIKCNLDGNSFYYVYAVCTLKEYRGRGFSTELLSFAKNECHNLCLIPANEGLIDFYSKRGFDKKCPIDKLYFSQPKVLIDEYLFEGCELDEPIIMINEG